VISAICSRPRWCVRRRFATVRVSLRAMTAVRNEQATSDEEHRDRQRSERGSPRPADDAHSRKARRSSQSAPPVVVRERVGRAQPRLLRRL
jgi:hypothetical protein